MPIAIQCKIPLRNQRQALRPSLYHIHTPSSCYSRIYPAGVYIGHVALCQLDSITTIYVQGGPITQEGCTVWHDLFPQRIVRLYSRPPITYASPYARLLLGTNLASSLSHSYIRGLLIVLVHVATKYTGSLHSLASIRAIATCIYDS